VLAQQVEPCTCQLPREEHKLNYARWAIFTLAAALFTPCLLAHADQLTTYANVPSAVTVVTGPTSAPVWQITSSFPSGWAGLEDQITGLLTPALLTQLSADYEFTTGTIGGGAPRFTLFDSSFNSAYVYFGTPTGGGGFTDPTPGTYANTGNYADLLSTSLRVASNGFGGDNTPNTYTTWATFVANNPNVAISYITYDLDGGFTGTQTIETGNFQVNDTIYNPAGSPVPEPASLLLLGTGLLGAGGEAWRRLKSKSA